MSKFNDIKNRATKAVRTAIESSRLLPKAARQPAIIKDWLWGVDKARTLIATGLIMLPLIAIPIADKALNKIFPAHTKKQFLGLMKRTKANPLLKPATIASRVIIWTGFPGTGLVLLLSMLPVAYGRREDQPGAQGDATVIHSGDTTRISSTGGTNSTEKAHRYKTGELLGHGAMGVVFKAHDSTLERDVALKELPGNLTHVPELVTRFRQEAKVLARLAHPAIVQVYDLIEEDNRFWMVIEIVQGGDMGKILKQGALVTKQASSLGYAIADGMAYAHEMGIIHRDLKPANILITTDGKPKITDFGLAKLAENNELTQAGTIMGSPTYISPEQARGVQADSRADIYSLGVMLYQMFTGEVPFTGDDMPSLLKCHMEQAPAAPKEIKPRMPKAINELILSMLEKSPEDRTQDMRDVMRVLSKFAG